MSMIYFKRNLMMLLCVGLMLLASGAAVDSQSAALAPDTRAAINQQVTRAEGRRGQVSALVTDLDSGRTLYSHNADNALIPASNMKVLTTVLALKTLGADFEFVTRLYADANLSNGTLGGHLYVLGGGDPNISGRFHDNDPLAIYRDWAAQLKAAGITKIDGDLRYDSTLFGGDSFHSGWPQDDQYVRWYCAEVSALAFNDNCVAVRVVPTSAGQRARIEVIPPTAYVRIVNETTTAAGNSGAEIGILRPRGSNVITVRGRVFERATWGFRTDVTVSDPARFAATVLRETLESEGIEVTGDVTPHVLTRDCIGKARVLVEHRSSLLDALPAINTNSQNLHAELVFRQLGLRYAGKGTFLTGSAGSEAALRDRGWWEDGLVIADGSGLARDNRVSARLMVRLLSEMADSEGFEAFRDSLAVAGETGTLQRRLRGRDVRGKVYAKTGYIRNVRALSGYILTDNRRIAFSILMNNCAHSRDTQDEIVEILAKACR
jgi:serine-type D-Ala-D-Ala carboxypeptidase/endopeptidase (penicillin-binding protein 4)